MVSRNVLSISLMFPKQCKCHAHEYCITACLQELTKLRTIWGHIVVQPAMMASPLYEIHIRVESRTIQSFLWGNTLHVEVQEACRKAEEIVDQIWEFVWFIFPDVPHHFWKKIPPNQIVVLCVIWCLVLFRFYLIYPVYIKCFFPVSEFYFLLNWHW